MVRLLKNKEMKEYLENRIKELREADAKFCNDRWDMSKHQLVRAMARENSNSVTLARQELETALKFFNNLTIPIVNQRSELLFKYQVYINDCWESIAWEQEPEKLVKEYLNNCG